MNKIAYIYAKQEASHQGDPCTVLRILELLIGIYVATGIFSKILS